MNVRLHDTKAQALRDFVPLDPDNVTTKTAKKVQKAWDAYEALEEKKEFVNPALYDKLVQCHDQLMS